MLIYINAVVVPGNVAGKIILKSREFKLILIFEEMLLYRSETAAFKNYTHLTIFMIIIFKKKN